MKNKKLLLILSLVTVLGILVGCNTLLNPSSPITITQHADITGNQAMFYTLETPKGELIVIDGGHEVNAEYVRSVISQKGNHVSAWILTHQHQDHAGAFNEIYANPKDITIDAIYTNQLDYDMFKQYAMEWDDFEVYQTFCDLTASAENLTYLHSGDELEICGIPIKIYSAYDNSTINYSADLANCGSLMFEVFGANSSILYCGDVYGEPMCNKIISEYGEELSATYLQMGHHGNNSITRDFFIQVQPKVAIFDAPTWLIQGEQYDTLKNMQMAEEAGASTYSFETAPNVFILD